MGLIVGVCKELHIGSGILDDKGMELPFHYFDNLSYNRKPDGKMLYGTLSLITEEIPVSSAGMGDLMLFTINKHPQHLAIATGEGTMIHALREASGVTENPMQDYWLRRLYKAFAFKQPIPSPPHYKHQSAVPQHHSP